MWFTRWRIGFLLYETVLCYRRYPRQRVQFNHGNQRFAGGLFLRQMPNGEAEVLKIVLKPKPRIKKLNFEADFGELAIKGRQSMGNILTKYEVHKISLKEKGHSTLGGRKIWFDEDVLRLNADNRGKYLGEFSGEDKILVLYKRGDYQLYNFDLSNHFEPDILTIEKFDRVKFCRLYISMPSNNFTTCKRFEVEDSGR